MQPLNYDTLCRLHDAPYFLEEASERILQFGEGNFLRAFVDYFVDIANEKQGFDAKVVVVQPLPYGKVDEINEQQGLYTLYLRGFEKQEAVVRKRVISCISRCINPYTQHESYLECASNLHLRYIVSNTTEAGIAFNDLDRFEDAPASSFPAKLTRFLYERFRVFGERDGKGLVILACELIDNNGALLRQHVLDYINLWGLGDGFRNWVETQNTFCSTLVDRIVTGYPFGEEDELNQANGYTDKLLVCAEVFGFWVIEGSESLAAELPFEKAGLPVIVVRDSAPYKERKVRILNGAHTSMVLAAYLAGFDFVHDCMQDNVILSYMNKTVYDEIIPTLSLPESELNDFAKSVQERFSNPFIKHPLLSIALNSTSKWKARVLPSLKGYYVKFGRLPQNICFSFAAYLAFYRKGRLRGGKMTATRDGKEYQIIDDSYVIDFFDKHRPDSTAEIIAAVCSDKNLWGEDLLLITGFAQAAGYWLDCIENLGAYAAMQRLIGGSACDEGNNNQ